MTGSIAEYMQAFVDTINAPEVTTVSAVFKLLVSMALGSIVGYERKRKGQIAGVRTFSLICMGATLAMILSIYIPQEYLGLKNGDPGRIAAQVVSGIGFLGAGAIIQMKGSVRGLTTAAGIWMVAALGMAVGVGLYITAVAAMLLILFVLMSLERIEHRNNLGIESRTVTATIEGTLSSIDPYKKMLDDMHLHLINYYITVDYTANTTKLNLIILARENVDMMEVFTRIRAINPTLSISLSNQVSI